MEDVFKQVKFLDGTRFNDEANKIYKVPVDQLPKRNMVEVATGFQEEVIDFEHKDTLEMIVGFIKHHTQHQVPRLQELKRYALADNNINYRPSKASGRADNRIASDFAKFIVQFKRGVTIGNPVEYKGNESITERVSEFSSQANEGYHNQLMADDMFGYGRAFELVTRNDHGREILAKLDVEQTFVIYNTAIEMNSICGIRYYSISYQDKKDTYVEVYANDEHTYTFIAEDNKLEDLKSTDDGREQSFFNAVQINEWSNNEDRTSDYEAVLDIIDAYDLSRSEMANFQQDMSEALLVIKGNPDTFKKEDGSTDTEGLDYTIKNRILVLGDRKQYDNEVLGSEPDAKYLTKTYDVQGIEAYNDRLVADLLRFTSLIDFTDENIGSNQSGIGFRFKGWGSDNDRKNKERMIKKALMRRLRLLAYSWSKRDAVKPNTIVDKVVNFFATETMKQNLLYEEINKIEVKFTPNVPQSDEEIMKVIAGMAGIVSDQTIYEMSSRLTGVDSEEEARRVLEEFKDRTNQHDEELSENQETEEADEE